MSETLARIRQLVADGEVKVSEHGYEEMAEDGILVRDVVDGLGVASVVEDYPLYPKGPCVLVLEKDRDGEPIHVVWGMPKGHRLPAVIVTAYRPDAKRWTDDYLRRR